MDTITVGLLCTLIGALGTFLTQKRNVKQDTKEETKSFTQVETKIDYISKGVDDIRIDIKSQDRKINDINERLIRVEESAKSAHKRIDNVEKEGV